MTLLLYMVADGGRRGYRHLLEDFWDEARTHGLCLPTEEAVSPASFCNARRKITAELLKQILQTLACSDLASDSLDEHRWHGRKVFAIDGTKWTVPRDDELIRHFGASPGAYYPQALVSLLYDVCADTPIDVEVAPYIASERDHLFDMLPSLERGSILLMDRGYPAHDVFQALAEEGVDFLARVQIRNTFGVIEHLRDIGAVDEDFILEVPRLGEVGWKELKLRFVRIDRPGCEPMLFFTSLPREEVSREQIDELYHLRWRVEEHYKLAKHLYLKHWEPRSRTVEGVVQEIYAHVLFLAVSRLLMTATARAAGRHLETISQKAAVLSAAAYLTRVFLASGPRARQTAFHDLLVRISRARESPRPGRSYPRCSLRPTPAWSPAGRRGR